jgi:hypothetical protein
MTELRTRVTRHLRLVVALQTWQDLQRGKRQLCSRSKVDTFLYESSQREYQEIFTLLASFDIC